MLTYQESIDKMRKARSLIEQGWCRKHFNKQIGNRKCYCVLGAMARSEISITSNTAEAFQKYCANLHNKHLAEYNDSVRDKRYILRLIDGFIRSLERGDQY